MPKPEASAPLKALDAYFGSPDLSDDVMTLPELDGFLAGIAAGPQAIAQAEWLPLIWGESGPPSFADDDEGRTILAAIAALQAEIVALIADGTYMPLLPQDTDDAPLPEVWAAGFMTAAGLRVEAWATLFESEDDDSIAYPILAFCEDETGKPLLDLTTRDREILRNDAPDHIAQAVLDIADYWQQKNKPLPPGAIPVRTAPKIGRNDPCPCGSGKKYKKCCGA